MRISLPGPGRAPRVLGGRVSLAIALAFFDASTALAQCALCRDAVAASAPETREAMNVAIIGLAFAPYVVGALAAWVLLPPFRTRVRAWFLRRTVGASSPS